jgi:hypothetical protein
VEALVVVLVKTVELVVAVVALVLELILRAVQELPIKDSPEDLL